MRDNSQVPSRSPTGKIWGGMFTACFWACCSGVVVRFPETRYFQSEFLTDCSGSVDGMHKLFMKLAHAYLARRVRQRPPRPLAELDPGPVRRVLLISNTALGDTLFSTPAIRALKERYPAWELEVLAHRVFGALLAHNPHVAKIWTYPGRNRRLLRLVRELRRRLRPGDHPARQRPRSHPAGAPHREPLYHRLGQQPLGFRLLRPGGARRSLGARHRAAPRLCAAPGRRHRRTSAWTCFCRRRNRRGRGDPGPNISGRCRRGSWPCIPPAPTPTSGGRRRPSSNWGIICPKPTRPRC